MAHILPFAGIRPVKDKAAQISSRSPDRYSQEQLQEILRQNPYSFLHIIFPDFSDNLHTKAGSKERLEKIKSRYLEFCAKGWLVQEDKPVYYIYRQENQGNQYTGIIACSGVEDYLNGVIKIHEETLTDREEKLREYLEVCDYNSEPVLFCYPDHAEISSIIQRKIQDAPEYDFITTGEVRHILWLVDEDEAVNALRRNFDSLPAIYIADGHHRSSSSALLAKSRKEKHPEHSGSEPWNYFLGIYFPESELKIFDYNRLVKDLNGLDKEVFFEKISADFEVIPHGSVLFKPAQKFTFSLYLDQEWFELKLKPGRADETIPAESLDAALLTRYILAPVLGIQDLKNDKRIGFIEGTRGVAALAAEVDSGRFALAFGLFPVQMQELKAIADTGAIMPPKTTWIEPKLRNGLVIYSLS